MFMFMQVMGGVIAGFTYMNNGLHDAASVEEAAYPKRYFGPLQMAMYRSSSGGVDWLGIYQSIEPPRWENRVD